MSEAPLPKYVCWRAALCHWSGLFWLPIAIGAFALFPEQLLNNYRYFFSFFLVPSISVLLAVPWQWLLWQLLRPQHEFIALCGRDAINFGCSASLYLLLFASIFFASCGISGSNPISIVLGVLSLITLWCLFFVHFILVLGNGINACKGRDSNYPPIIQFFR
jgi:uncharacterized Tic20 family protein